HAHGRRLGLDVLVEVHDEPELARAIELGAELIGINNRDLTTLEVDTRRALELRAGVPEGTVTVAESGYRTRAQLEELQAAGFDNPTLEYVTQVAEAAELTMLQFHGDEGPAFCSEAARRTGCKVIKAARVRSGAEIQALAPFHTDFHLLDGYAPGLPGGTGESFAWELAREHRGKLPLILSGGLTADNVAQAIEAVQPFAVDVASGVELSPGRKDPAKLEAFSHAVAGANAATRTAV